MYDILHLDSDESVIFEVRKHWIVFFGRAASLLFSAFLPFILFSVIQIFLPLLFAINLPGNTSALFLFFYSLWLLFLWISFFVDWTKYYLDVWYVTEKRIIIVEQKKMFEREISNVYVDKVQDVIVDIQGGIATFLNFGTVKVETASEDQKEFCMSMVQNPDSVRKVIFTHTCGTK